MAIRTELCLRLPNSPGALARVTSLLAEERVHIIALTLESGGTTRLVVDKVTRATEILSRHQVHSDARDVLCTVVSSLGIAPILTAAAAADVNLEYAYASSVDDDAGPRR